MKNENVTLQFNKREYIMTQVVITFTRQPHENIPVFHNPAIMTTGNGLLLFSFFPMIASPD